MKKTDESQLSIIKFKKQFKKIKKFDLPSPWETNPWLHSKDTYKNILISCRDDMKFSIDENELFLGKTIVNSLGKEFTILSMFTEFLMNSLSVRFQ
jgi:hypothetical protein